MTEIKINDLKDLCTKVLLKTGLTQEHVDITVDHYLENELSGKASHGMVRVIQATKAIAQFGIPNQGPETIKDTGNMVSIKGHNNLGPVLGRMILEQSIDRAQEHGIAFVGGFNYIINTGSMAYYLRRLTDKNLIGFMSCNSVATVSAPSSKDALIGTNPIGLGIPSHDANHFIADFATSAMAYGKVLVAMDKGEPLPEGCIIDKDGNPSTNPKDAFPDGAILPLADYRGFALGLFVEMIAMMVGADVLDHELHGKDGLFIIAIDPSKLSDVYANRVHQILDQIRNSAPAPEHNSVSIPGDRSAKTLQETLKRGSVDVADKTLEKLRDLTT